ncbi:ABC transporter permease subunit [Isachenkonia alkalipeptolytica]|uniref:ABC transporter permease subunit n=1 Tax=Isachenkonia alkalipeptolytica TaxID=2565777 RepID=A0AA44BEX7_9CLOT|nr:ABC transporter permease subunit [Isachenkonia alkalipeptolytica]NBG89472.1 ABC transporter permease subunit [Isachenkonia alkalipeptolytica]
MVSLLRRINFPLLVGGVLVLVMLFAYFFPQALTDKNPNVEESAKYIEIRQDGEWVEEFATRPFPPNRENIMGSDEAGRDIYTRIIYGTRNTLRVALLVVLLRILVAMPLGIMAGMGVKPVSVFINMFNTFFTTIPKLLIAFVILNINYFRNLEMDRAIVAFAVVLTVIGWSKLASMIEDQTALIMEEDFIEGEVAVGKNPLQIGVQNLLPHLIPHVVSFLFIEIGMVLFLLAQLSVLTVFVGPRRMPLAEAFQGNFEMAFEPEWGSMLARAPEVIRLYPDRMWLTLFPALAFFLGVTAFNLTGEGLRIEFQKRNSQIVSFIRKGFFMASPKIYWMQLRNLKQYWRPVAGKSLTVILILGYFSYPAEASQHPFNVHRAKAHVEELTDEKYQGRLVGFEGGHKSGDYIIETLKSYDLEPWEGSYTQEFSPLDEAGGFYERLLVEEAYIEVDHGEGPERFYINEDFILPALGKNVIEPSEESLNEEGWIEYQGKTITYHQDHTSVTITDEQEYIPLIDVGGYGDIYSQLYVSGQSGMFARSVSHDFPTENDPRGISYNLGILDTDLYDRELMDTYSLNRTLIIPFEALRGALDGADVEVGFFMKPPKLPSHPGRNITALLPGKNWEEEGPREMIVIGAPYDGAYTGGRKGFSPAITATPAATNLEIARVLSGMEEPLEKTVMFIFWDGEYSLYPRRTRGSFHYTASQRTFQQADFPYNYIDVGYTGNEDLEQLEINIMHGQKRSDRSYLMRTSLSERLQDLGVDYRMFDASQRWARGSTSHALYGMNMNSQFSLGFGSNYFSYINHRDADMDTVNFEYMENMGQIIVDSITMNPHLKEPQK